MQVQLLLPHTHGGIDYLPGSLIELGSVDQARWLIQAGVARMVQKPRHPNASDRALERATEKFSPSIFNRNSNFKDSTS